MQGWRGNAQHLEVRSFRAGSVASARNRFATVYCEYIPKGGRRRTAEIETQNPSLVVLDGWGHPKPPDGFVRENEWSFKGRWSMFAPEWRVEFDAFLKNYLGEYPQVCVLADYRQSLDSVEGSSQIAVEHQVSVAIKHAHDADLDLTFDPPATDLYEGAKHTQHLSIYERNPAARRECIRVHGWSCAVCEFDFGRAYGELGEKYIHVHHLTPIASIDEEYRVDPGKDLVPICPNCHAMIHRCDPMLTLDQLQRVLRDNSKIRG